MTVTTQVGADIHPKPLSVATYVVERQVDERDWQVVGVRLSLDSAFAFGEEIVGNHPTHGSPREWKIDWREGTAWNHLDGDGEDFRSWDGHRPRRPEPTHTFIGHDHRPQTWSETCLGVTITEHLAPAEIPTETTGAQA